MKKYLANKNILSLINNFIGVFFGTANIFLLSRGFHSKELFGIWIIYVTSIEVLEMLKNGLMRPPLIRFLSGCEVPLQRKQLIGSNWLIGLVFSLFIALILFLIKFFFSDIITGKGFFIFFTWYPLLTIIRQPLNNAISIFLSELDFRRTIIFQFIQQGGFSVFLLIYFFNGVFDVSFVVVVHLLSFLAGSFLVIIFKFDGHQYVGFTNSATRKKLLNFGFYTMGVQLIGNLGKNSDQLLLGVISVSGPVAVALYTIPLKISGVIKTFIGSFINVSFQRMAVAKQKNDFKTIEKIFYQQTGVLSITLIPVLVLFFIFSEELVVILGGSNYAETASVLRIFLFYLAFIPINKYLGTMLVVLDKPKLNLIRAIVSLVISITLNATIILVWDNLNYMAYTKIIVILVSVLLGVKLLQNDMKVSLIKIYKTGINSVWLYISNIKSNSI